MTHINYQFGEFYLDTASRNLLCAGKLTRLSPRAFDILLHLIKNHGRVVKKEELIEIVWTDSFVEENNLPVHISALRRVLKERETETKHIETVSGRGYCFLTSVKELKSPIPHLLSNSSAPNPSEIRSIAVLPFANKNDDSESDYLAAAITDSLISKLSKISQLKVISYSAVRQYQNTDFNLQEVGFLLGVDSILTGSIFEIGDELEIQSELVKVGDLSRLWGTQYQCKPENLFKTKTEISAAIADKLQIQLTKSEAKQITKQPTENSEAYQLYLKGRRFLEAHTKQELLKSIDYFNEALKIDSKFALAYADIGYAYLYLAIYFYAPTKETVSKSKQAIQKALTIDENLAEAYAIKGYSQLFELNLTGANQSFRKALELNHNSAYSHGLYGLYLLAVGDFQESLTQHYKSIELNPRLNSFAALSSMLMLMGEFQKAIDNWESSIELFPTFNAVHYGLALSYALLGKFDLALKNVQVALGIICSTENIALDGYIQALSGNHKEARKIIKQLIHNFDDAPVDLYDIAVIYNALGETDKAFEYIEKAYQSKFSHLLFLKIDPRMKSLHSDSRFESILQRLGLA